MSKDTGQIARLVRGEIQQYITDKRYLRKDGTVLWGHLSVSPVRDTAGNVLYFVPLIVDISERKQSEAALAEEISRRSKLFEQTPVGIVIIDPPTARIMEFNTIAHQQLSYSREEFAALTIMDIEAKETAAETAATIARVLKEGRTDFDTLQCTKQGEIRNVHVTAQAVNVAGKTVYQCIWQDITENKRVEEAIKSAAEEWRNTFDSITDMISIIDKDHRLVRVNKRFADILKSTPCIDRPALLPRNPRCRTTLAHMSASQDYENHEARDR